MTVRRLVLPLSVALLALAGCGEDGNTTRATGSASSSSSSAPTTEAPEQEIELTRSGGCGDAYLWAATEDGRLAVTVNTDLRDRSTTEPTTLAVDLPDPEIEAVVLRAPGDLTVNFCVDLLEPESEPTSTVAVTAGTGEIVIDAVDPERGPDSLAGCGDTTARAELAGVEAEDGTTFAPVTIVAEGIGCYAG